MNLSNPDNPMMGKGGNSQKTIFPVFTYWLMLFALFVIVLFVSSDGSQIFSDVKFMDRAIIGAGGCLLGMAGGWILLGVFTRQNRFAPEPRRLAWLQWSG